MVRVFIPLTLLVALVIMLIWVVYLGWGEYKRHKVSKVKPASKDDWENYR